ncbi:MAG: hypothetical protein HW416_305 [Chloroflexi bacterium]|nr:hypothetical protein [Chloroflexota bacterium]
MLTIAPTSFFGDYGCHVRIVEEVQALMAHGIDSTIVTYPFGRDIPGFSLRRSPKLPGQRNVDPGSSLHKLSMDAALAVRAASAAAEQRPALVHGHLHEGALIGWSVARTRRIPLLFDFQGSLTSEMVDHGFIQPRSTAFHGFRAVETWIVRRADAIVTSTYHGADVLVRDFGCPATKITVVPDAVNTARFRPLWEVAQEDGHLVRAQRLREQLGIPVGLPVVVYLGLLAEYQGITHLLRAAQALFSRGLEAHFLIMGFPGENRYRDLANRLGLGPHVTFTGAIPYEDAPVYLSLGDIAVSPKLSETEGNGKLLNYIAMGLPTVAFDTSVSREILEGLGVYAPPGDWTALAAEIEGLLRDQTRVQQLARALRSMAIEKHSWDRSGDALVEVYRSLAS